MAAAAAASVAALSVTATQALPLQRFGVFALPVVSIHRFWLNRSATSGAADCTITLPLLPARFDADCAACCAAVTFWLVVAKLLPRLVIELLAEESSLSVCVTRTSSAWLANARAPVARADGPATNGEGVLLSPIRFSIITESITKDRSATTVWFG
ncbi:hypothetical protein D3C81_1601820 [compost metagenome]